MAHGPNDDDLHAQAFGAVRTSRLLGPLDHEDLALVLEHATAIRRARGGLLVTHGDDRVVVLLSGAAKEHRETPHDPEVVLRLLAPGDVAGLSSALGTPSGGDVTALGPCRAVVLPGGELRGLARTRPAIANAWLRAVTEQLSDLRTRTWAFASTSTSRRVICRLLELSDRFGEDVGCERHMRCELTQAELASWAGASRESTAKTLHTLRRAGLVTTRRRELTLLDPSALRHRHGDCPRHPSAAHDRNSDEVVVLPEPAISAR